MEKKDSAERKKEKISNRTIKDVGEIGVPIWCALGSASDAINDAGGVAWGQHQQQQQQRSEKKKKGGEGNGAWPKI